MQKLSFKDAYARGFLPYEGKPNAKQFPNTQYCMKHSFPGVYIEQTAHGFTVGMGDAFSSHRYVSGDSRDRALVAVS